MSTPTTPGEGPQANAAFGGGEFNFGPNTKELSSALKNAQTHPQLPRLQAMHQLGQGGNPLPHCPLYGMLWDICLKEKMGSWELNENKSTGAVTFTTPSKDVIRFTPSKGGVWVTGKNKDNKAIDLLQEPGIDGTKLFLGATDKGCIEPEVLESFVTKIIGIGQH